MAISKKLKGLNELPAALAASLKQSVERRRKQEGDGWITLL